MSDISYDQKIKKALNKYCEEVNKYFKAGNIESSYNKPVIDLIQSFECTAHDFSGQRSGETGENIDIKLWHEGEDINNIPPFGAIEVKKVGGKDERARKQILIEAQKFGNVILTDNLVWEFYNDESDKMYNGFILLKKGELDEFIVDESKIDLFISSIKSFILKKPSNIKSSNQLAYYMAEYAKIIKTIVFNILNAKKEDKPMYQELFALFSKIKQELLPDLNINEFSDMYAQTIVYGLFIARYNDNTLNSFSKGEAISNLTKESHLLKQFFQHVATSDNLHPTLDETINKLCELFALTDLKKLLDQYEKKDAIVHFYEDFLGYYDIKQKKQFGAYYTPVPIVDYMVRMVDELLVNDFNINNGFANNETINITVKSDEYVERKKVKNEKEISVPKVAILDPACGTGTFGAEIIKYVKEKYFSNGNEIFYSKWLQDKNSLMSRLISFEIMMTSYVIAHLKIRRTLLDTLNGENIENDIKTNIYLTNTLAEPKSILERNAQLSLFDFSGAITEEAEQADKWKCRRPIRVIIGNPPYLAASKNEYDISSYKFETDGITPFGEKKHLLNDDYVKFIRFAEQHIQKDGEGILAFITNNGYLDNQTFRGMRASLLRTFDKIYIVNLHGNSIKKEQAPDGGKDENVFDIMVGVAIMIGVKTSKKEDWAKVYYSDLYGLREDKFKHLELNDIEFKELTIDRKNAFFIPIDTTNKDEYNNGISLEKLFVIQSTGTDSGNDNVAIGRDKQTISQRVNIVKNALSNEPIINLFGRFGRGGTPEQIKQDVDRDGVITELNYRPFDVRWTYYSGVCGWLSRTKSKVMQHFINKDNIGIIFTRGGTSSRDFSSVFVTNKITDIHFFADVAYIAPLYIYNGDISNEKNDNFNKEEFEALTVNLSNKPSPIKVFDYCYGVLNDINYRKKYNEFLRRDYPRIPIIENEEMFEKYSNAGEKLRKIHLMEIPVQKELSIESDTKNLIIDLVKHQENKVYINKETAVSGISDEIWSYCIGGYQVIDKLLKGYKGETLTLEIFNTLKKIVGIIEETIMIQNELK